MRITSEALGPGSRVFRIWLNEPPGDDDPGTDIDTIGFLKRLNQDECEIAAFKGDLTDEANIEIGLMAMEFGYKVLHFHRSEGGKASHWAEYLKTVNGMDYYRVDLIKAAAEL